MLDPSLPGPLTSLCPPALQINRPPVKLNLLTCQVRPHAEEKKCFDLVTRECPGRGARAGVGVCDMEVAGLGMGTPFFGGGHTGQVFSAALPWLLGTLCPFNPALGVSPAAFAEEGPTSPRRSSKKRSQTGLG